MRRRFSSRTSSETAGRTSLRSASIPPSRSSLGRQNSSQSSWHPSASKGVSIGSVAVTSASRPLSVSGSMGGMQYLPSVSPTVISMTHPAAFSTSMVGPQRPQPVLGTSERCVSHVLRARDAADGVGGSRSSCAAQATKGPVLSAGLLSGNRSSFSSGGHAFVRFSSRVSMARASPGNSHPIIGERMRMIRESRKVLFSGTEDSSIAGRATLQRSTSTVPSMSPGASTRQLDTEPRIFASTETTMRQGRKELLVPRSIQRASSADDVGKDFFSQWSTKKNEPFSDVFQGTKDFFADLRKHRKDDDNQSRSHSQKWNGGSSRSDLLMTTILEMAEKDANETSADKHKAQSTIEPSTKDMLSMSIAKGSLPQTLTSSVKTIPKPYSDELLKALDTKKQATEAKSEKTSREMVLTAAKNQNGWLVECGSTTSAVTESKTELKSVIGSHADTAELRATGTELQVTRGGRRPSSVLAAKAHTVQGKKSLNLLRASVWSTERVSARSEALADSSVYIPALRGSSSGVAGVTSGDHIMVPRSLDGPATVFSETTEFSVFDATKMSDPETSKSGLPAQNTGGDKQKNWLTERSLTPEHGIAEGKSARCVSRTSKVSYPSEAPRSL